MLIGGDKTGNKRFYNRMVPIADDLYDAYLKEIEEEGLVYWQGIESFRRFAAMPLQNGRLELIAHMPAGDVVLTQFTKHSA